LRIVLTPQVPVAIPEHLAVAVDDAVAGERDVLFLVDVDERCRPRHFDAGDARRQQRIIFNVLRSL
jgi:hypothetical protein